MKVAKKYIDQINKFKDIDHIRASWVAGHGIFQFCESPARNRDFPTGCLTMVHNTDRMNGMANYCVVDGNGPRDDLTAMIRSASDIHNKIDDLLEALPDDVEGTLKVLLPYAGWQTYLDEEIRDVVYSEGEVVEV